MNRLFLSLAFLFSVLVLNAQTRIDFDYTRVFTINSMWVDFNQNNKVEDGETYTFEGKGDCEIYIEHKDFNSAGNLMRFKVTIKGNGKKEFFSNTLEDVEFVKKENLFSVKNKLDELLFGLTNENGKWYLLIFNPAILMK